MKRYWHPYRALPWAVSLGLLGTQACAQTLTDPDLEVRTVVAGLTQPIGLAFLGANDFLVIEKPTGRVRRVTNGVVGSTALDLAVNSASERGLLGIALHPMFPLNPRVYLYWSESSTGADSTDAATVPLLGNRVDAFLWNGSSLTFEANLLKLRAYQADAGQPIRGNHNGGVIRFGPDGKLYAIIGDNGRRGWLQNNKMGPTPDDQFGGPFPDAPHATGAIYRLNDDGTIPGDNPFASLSATPSVRSLYAYGIRNSFGMDFDPVSGQLWTEENGGNSFDEINRVEPGSNCGWIQVMGPLERVAQYKQIEIDLVTGLQQLRWPPTRIADTPALAQRRMVALPGSHYRDPELSWKYALAPAGIGFVKGAGLGASYEGDLIVGASRTTLLNGYLFRLKLTPDRKSLAFSDSRLEDKVADNLAKFGIDESESLLMGAGFGVVPALETSPDGTMVLASLDQGAIYEVRRKTADRVGAPDQRRKE